ncbi:MAG: hypothetical protein HW386_1458, partial [Gammaproteobacteria bacterium]|nr:hypothetical protein [Gammaproteobacteria bacterium]
MKRFSNHMITILTICFALATDAQDNPPMTEGTATQVQQDAATRQKELAAARERLEQAAREVAELSGQAVGAQVMTFIDGMHMGQRKAMLGINIGGTNNDGK